jgi:hypothetical protein
MPEAPTVGLMGRAAVVAVVVIAVFAGAAAPAHAQTRKEWAKAANVICKREYAKVHAAIDQATANPPQTVRQWTRWVEKMIAPMKRIRRDVGALSRPRKDRSAIGKVLVLMDRSLGEFDLARAATVKRRLADYRLHMKRALTYGARIDALFQRLGANVCAEG